MSEDEIIKPCLIHKAIDAVERYLQLPDPLPKRRNLTPTGGYSEEFKKEVAEYRDRHTHKETRAKYKISDGMVLRCSQQYGTRKIHQRITNEVTAQIQHMLRTTDMSAKEIAEDQGVSYSKVAEVRRWM